MMRRERRRCWRWRRRWRAGSGRIGRSSSRWFGSEEAGGVGARHFLDSPPVPLERIVANIEFEMIGRPRFRGAAEDALAHRLRALEPRAGAGEARRAPRRRSASRAAILHAVRQHPARVPGRHRADGLELRAPQGVPHGGGRPGAHRLRAHDGVDSIDARPVLWLANSKFMPEWLPGQKPAPGNPCR